MKKMLSVLFVLSMILGAYAQSADVITEMLESEEATFGQVSYLAAVQMNLINEKDTYETAIQKLYDNEVIPSVEDPSAPIPVVDAVYIYSKLWNIKGGLLFRLTKGSPRYAFKQFKSDGIIDSELDPAAHISGATALSLYTSCVNKYSDFDMKKVSMEDEE